MGAVKAQDKPDEKPVKVTAVHPYQIAYGGKIAGPGESLAVPPEVAESWRLQGLAE
jgi:hypothetical protein